MALLIPRLVLAPKGELYVLLFNQICDVVQKRPYFGSGIDELESLFSRSQNNVSALRQLLHELAYRDRPKAKALRQEVERRLAQLEAGATTRPVPAASPEPKPAARPTTVPSPPAAVPPAAARVAVACSHCDTQNFVSTLDGVLQHLSCSHCKAPFEAQFKYGVLRTTFGHQPSPPKSTDWRVVVFLIVFFGAVGFLLTNK
jgi:hypothetical protein